MEQQINLYSAVFEPKEILFPLPQMIMAWVAVLILCIGFFQMLDSKLGQMTKQLKQTEKTTKALAQVVREEKKRTEEMDLAPLENEIRNRQLHIAKARVLYGRISKEIESSRAGFHKKLQALSENTKQGLWLTKIKISNKDFSVEGKATNGNFIPDWIAGFSKTEGLRETRLNQLAIDKENERVVKFTITNVGGGRDGEL